MMMRSSSLRELTCWQKLTVVFLAGFFVSAAAVLLLIKAMGHLDVFTNAFKLVTQMGGSDGESAYGLMTLLRNFLTSFNVKPYP